MTIPASQIVSGVPSVLSAGGTPASASALFLTSGTRTPIGSVLSFPTTPAVIAYYGALSAEANAAAIYFGGFTGSSIVPPNLLFAQYPVAAVAGWLRGGSVASMTLTALKALTGILTITVGGTLFTSSTIVLTTATSFSSAAALIQAAFTAPTFSVTYDSIAGAFVFTSTATGSAATMTVCAGSLAAGLMLTVATGAVLSQGAAVAVPAAFMSAVLLVNTNWMSFTHLFDPDGGAGNTLKYAFAAWNGQQGNEYAYIPWDTDATAAAGTSTTCLMYLINAAGISGTMAIWGADNTAAVFACGIGASINWTKFNGRTTYAFRGQSGLVPPVNDPTTAANLIANGYNFYGGYALAANGWQFLYPGSVSGQFKWMDSYVNQIWMNNAIQLSLMTMLTNALSVPYNQDGSGLVAASVQVPIQAAVNFGAIRQGVTPSALEAQEMNNAAGVAIDATLATRGWYLQIGVASSQTRGARTSPPITLWYMDGGSMQQLSFASIEVQ